ncbi:MAG: hypothetical protein AAGJ18_21965 [Bacteroidota bacterium]
MQNFIGTWEIQEMETWDEDYFNMEVQAYITIKADQSGQFQFGLVRGYFSGGRVEDGKLFFNWEGSDEMDEASGSGWINPKSDSELEGFFSFHFIGDDSTFLATKKK